MKQDQNEDEFSNFLLQVKIGWPIFVASLLLFIAVGLYQAANVKKIYRIHVPVISHINLPSHQVYLLRELENRWFLRAGNEYFDYYLTRDIYDRENLDRYTAELVDANQRAVNKSMRLLVEELDALVWVRDQIKNDDSFARGVRENLTATQLQKLVNLQSQKQKVEANEPVITIKTAPLFLPEQNHKELIDWTHRPHMLEDRGPSQIVVLISAVMIGVLVSGFLTVIYVFVRRRFLSI